jgi:TonB family protein
MDFRIKNDTLLQNAFILSAIAHGVGLYALISLTTTNKTHIEKLAPIQITKIVFESPTIPQPKKEISPRHVEEILTEIKRHQPSSIRSRQAIAQVQPIVASMELGQIRNVSISANNPKPVKPFKARTTKPAYFEEGMKAVKVREPRNFAQPVKDADSVIIRPSSLPHTFPSGKHENKFRQLNNSVQPVRLVERVVLAEKSSQNLMTANISKITNAIPVSKVRARMISNKSNTLAAHRSPQQEKSHRIRTANFNHIHPVQLASLSPDFVADSQSEELEEKSKPSAISGQPELAGDPSGEEMKLLKKIFSSSIRRKIARVKYYPGIAEKKRWEGKPVIEFQVGRNGDLLDYSIAVASPYEILNQAAIDAVKEASPYPKIPESFKLNSIRFKLPIAFKLD